MVAVESGVNKFQRIQAVRKLGLNTEVSVLLTSAADWAVNEEFLSSESQFSVRTFRTEGLHLDEPHFPLVSSEELGARWRGWLEEGLRLIVGRPVDPADAELAGCLLLEDQGFLAEVAWGPGTVRRVTHDSQIDASFSWDPVHESIGDHRLDEAARAVRVALARVDRRPHLTFRGMIFEFSWYRIPVGEQLQPLIYWEVSGSAEQEWLLQEHLEVGPWQQ